MSMTRDPSEIHPEYDRPTPRNEDEWTEEQLDEWNEAKQAKLRKEARDATQELSEEQEQALEALEDPERPETATVEVGDATLEVKTFMNGRMERKANRIADTDDPQRVVDTAIDVITYMIEEPGEYADPDVWRAYREKWGSNTLFKEVFLVVMEPMLDEVNSDERVRKFREVGR